MSEGEILRVIERLVLILAIAPAAFPFLRRFRRELRIAAITLYGIAMAAALVLVAIYFLG